MQQLGDRVSPFLGRNGRDNSARFGRTALLVLRNCHHHPFLHDGVRQMCPQLHGGVPHTHQQFFDTAATSRWHGLCNPQSLMFLGHCSRRNPRLIRIAHVGMVSWSLSNCRVGIIIPGDRSNFLGMRSKNFNLISYLMKAIRHNAF